MEQVDAQIVEQSGTSVETFIQNLWFHNLVTEDSKRLRKELPAKAQNLLSTINVTPDQYVILPTGSLIGFSNEGSDTDAYAFMTESALGNYLQHYTELEKEEEPGHIQIHYPPNTIEGIAQDANDLHSENVYSTLAVLITPDSVAGGNMEALKKLRLELVQALDDIKNKDPQKLQQIMNTFNNAFKSHYSGWPEYDRGTKTPTRMERYQGIVNEYASKRAGESPVSDKEVLKQKLAMGIDKKRTELSLPDFDVLRNYIVENNGSIPL